MLPTTRELGVAVTAYGALSRGLLSGNWSPERAVDPTDFRSHAPRFAPENLAANLALVDALGAVAADVGATVAEVAIAWVSAAVTTSSRSSGPARRPSWKGCSGRWISS